jgi:hypothetical protein
MPHKQWGRIVNIHQARRGLDWPALQRLRRRSCPDRHACMTGQIIALSGGMAFN